jgi:hypothetical protein
MPIDYKKTEKELYLRKVTHEKLKTVLRHPIRRV